VTVTVSARSLIELHYLMNKQEILKLLHKRFGVVKPSFDQNQLSVNCPFCKDRGFTPNTTFKLSINIQIQKFHCFRCDIGGNLRDIVPQLSVLPEITAPEIEEKPKLLESLPSYNTLDKLSYPWDKLVYKFLHNKAFDPVSIANRVFFTQDYTKGNYSFGPRLLFPVYQQDRYCGFQGRTIYKNTMPKYIGADNMPKGEIVYNYDKAFSQHDMMVITEGFFDCIRVGDRAIATLGKNISERQIRLIQLGAFDKVVVFLDKDANKEAYQTAKKTAKYFSSYIALPDWDNLPLLADGERKKDPGDMTRVEIDYVLNNRLERVYG